MVTLDPALYDSTLAYGIHSRIAIDTPRFNCDGDFSVLLQQVNAAGIPELSTVLRAGVQQFKRNGLLRPADIQAIQDVCNGRLAELAAAEKETLLAAEREILRIEAATRRMLNEEDN